MRTLIACAVLLAASTATAGLNPIIVAPSGGSGQHTSSLQLHLDDDVLASFGNTSAAPDVWFDNNGASMCFTSTSIDGGGTDGDIFCYTLGGNILAMGSKLTPITGADGAPSIINPNDTANGIYFWSASNGAVGISGTLYVRTDAALINGKYLSVGTSGGEFFGVTSSVATFGVGIAPKALTGDPCATYGEGAIFYNTTNNYMCYCDGTNDVQIHNPAVACF